MTNSGLKPILMAVDDHIQDLETVQRELLKRYGADYDVLANHSAASALRLLRPASVRDESASQSPCRRAGRV